MLERPNNLHWADAASYDFAQARQLSPEQLRAADHALARAVAAASQALTEYMGRPVALAAASVAEVSADEWLAAAPTEGHLLLVGWGEELDRGLWCMPRSLADQLVEVVSGAPSSRPDRAGDLTPVEVAWLQRVITEALAAITEAWGTMTSAALRPEGLCRSRADAEALLELRRVVSIPLEFTLGDNPEQTSLALPADQMRKWLDAVAGRDRPPDDRARGLLRAQTERTPLPIRARLPSTRTPLAAILRLRPGDVLRLDARAAEPVVVLAGQVRKFTAWMGVHRGRVALELVSVPGAEDLLGPDSP